jgi:hypothetical protein
MIALVIIGLSVLVLAAITMVGSFAMFILAASIVPILGMFGFAAYEGFGILHERKAPEAPTRAKTHPVRRGLGRLVPHH